MNTKTSASFGNSTSPLSPPPCFRSRPISRASKNTKIGFKVRKTPRKRLLRRLILTSFLEAYLHFPNLHFLNSKSEEELKTTGIRDNCVLLSCGVLLQVTESIEFVLFSTFLWLGIVWSCFVFCPFVSFVLRHLVYSRAHRIYQTKRG